MKGDVKRSLRFVLSFLLLLLLICVTLNILFSGQNDIHRFTDSYDLGMYDFPKRTHINSTSTNKGMTNQRKSHNVDQPATSFVLLVAYHRSGSTFAADIIQQSNKVFYFFEPLHGFNRCSVFTNNMCCNGNICSYPMSVQEESAIVRIQLSYIFSCEMQKVHKSILNDVNQFGMQSIDETFYYKCLRSNRREVCVKQLGERCDRSHVRLIKTIRLTFDFVEDLLKSHKNLKILHLVRDPPGHFASEADIRKKKRNTTIVDKKHLQYQYNFFCKRLLDDISVSENLKRIYGGRIKTILYEDIATHPIQSLHEIYNYIGIPVTKYIKDYVFKHTMSGLNDAGYYDTQRSNSTETAYKWKKTLHQDTKLLIESSCKSFYDFTKFYPV